MKTKNQIYKLPICPRCKDTQYVGTLNYAILRTYQYCGRCAIEWDIYGNIQEHSFSPLKIRINKEAERLWEEAGKPEGRSEEFWFQAERNLLLSIANILMVWFITT